MSVTPPPYGQNPYGGSGSGQYPVTGPTPPAGKPTLASSLAIATELWVVVTVAQIVAVCGQFTQVGDQIDQVRADMAEQGQSISSGALIAIVIVTAIVMIGGVCGTLTWLARSGRNWARLGLGFLSFYIVVQAVYAFFVDGSDHWTMVPTVIGGVAALGAGVLLVHRDSDKYCKDMAQWRAEQKRNPPTFYGQGQYPQQPYSPQQPYPGQPGHYPPPPDHHQPPAQPNDSHQSDPGESK